MHGNISSYSVWSVSGVRKTICEVRGHKSLSGGVKTFKRMHSLEFVFTPERPADKLFILMMSKNDYTKSLKFMTPGLGVMTPGLGLCCKDGVLCALFLRISS